MSTGRGRSGSGKPAARPASGTTFGPPGGPNPNGKREHSRSASNTTSQKRTVRNHVEPGAQRLFPTRVEAPPDTAVDGALRGAESERRQRVGGRRQAEGQVLRRGWPLSLGQERAAGGSLSVCHSSHFSNHSHLRRSHTLLVSGWALARMQIRWRASWVKVRPRGCGLPW